MDFNFKAAGIRTRRKRKIDAKNFALYETSAFLESRWNKSVLAPLDGSKWKSSLALAQGAVDAEFFNAYHSIRRSLDQDKRTKMQKTLAAYEEDCREVLRVVLCSQICAHADWEFEGVANIPLGLQLAAEGKILSKLEIEVKEWHGVLSAGVWLPTLLAWPRTSLPRSGLALRDKMDREFLEVKTVAEEARKVAIALVNATATQRKLYSTL
mmetsp:Transcript_13414/g.41512  ORF Transcript_13414/g.41512 Transcript_13414/m.41512 type:complete len:211 (+) Transcript_13414:80-712(+)